MNRANSHSGSEAAEHENPSSTPFPSGEPIRTLTIPLIKEDWEDLNNIFQGNFAKKESKRAKDALVFIEMHSLIYKKNEVDPCSSPRAIFLYDKGYQD
jgi:hypothetical protein